MLTGLVSDSLGPKIVQGAHEVTEMMTKQLEHWSHLHTLLQASLSEREQLMHTVARLEQDCDRVRKAREVDAAKHSQHVKDIYARMQREARATPVWVVLLCVLVGAALFLVAQVFVVRHYIKEHVRAQTEQLLHVKSHVDAPGTIETCGLK